MRKSQTCVTIAATICQVVINAHADPDTGSSTRTNVKVIICHNYTTKNHLNFIIFITKFYKLCNIGLNEMTVRNFYKKYINSLTVLFFKECTVIMIGYIISVVPRLATPVGKAQILKIRIRLLHYGKCYTWYILIMTFIYSSTSMNVRFLINNVNIAVSTKMTHMNVIHVTL